MPENTVRVSLLPISSVSFEQLFCAFYMLGLHNARYAQIHWQSRQSDIAGDRVRAVGTLGCVAVFSSSIGFFLGFSFQWRRLFLVLMPVSLASSVLVSSKMAVIFPFGACQHGFEAVDALTVQRLLRFFPI